MADEIRRLIRVRNQKGATFKRDGFGKKSQLSSSWRKPKGQHSKKREQRKAKGALPKPGFGSPISVRGMHPSGYYDILVFTLHDLEGLDPKTQAIRISANIGRRKRALIQEKALSNGLKVFNVREVPTSKKLEPEPVIEKEVKVEKVSKPKTKPKEEKKKEEAVSVKKEKKEPAKVKTKKKVKAETSEEEKPKKETKPKVSKKKVDTKSESKPKRPLKPKTESEKGSKTKPKTASKPATKSRKKTGTEVKDNE